MQLCRRKVVSYTSSEWEALWLANIAQWEKQRRICEEVTSPGQFSYLQEFLKETCTFHYNEEWCLVNDTVAANVHWLNKATLNRSAALPGGLANLTSEELSAQKGFRTIPERGSGQPRVFSKFVFEDEVTGLEHVEYIEPLVSHLRHPVARCGEESELLLTSRSYIMPPRELSLHGASALYFDAGASRWDSGAGGPSLSYITSVWKRYGLDFDGIFAYEARAEPGSFWATVPATFRSRVSFQQCFISSRARQHSSSRPFLPLEIERRAQRNDYVLLKLDIDSGSVEQGTVDHLLDAKNKAIKYVDELLWEHHVEGNYLLAGDWAGTMQKATIHDSYLLFLALRQRGVRAHSYV